MTRLKAKNNTFSGLKISFEYDFQRIKIICINRRRFIFIIQLNSQLVACYVEFFLITHLICFVLTIKIIKRSSDRMNKTWNSKSVPPLLSDVDGQTIFSVSSPSSTLTTQFPKSLIFRQKSVQKHVNNHYCKQESTSICCCWSPVLTVYILGQ